MTNVTNLYVTNVAKTTHSTNVTHATNVTYIYKSDKRVGQKCRYFIHNYKMNVSLLPLLFRGCKFDSSTSLKHVVDVLTNEAGK